MAKLKYRIPKLEEIEEAHRGFYVEKDGEFMLDVEDLPDGDKLNGALAKEREETKKLKAALKPFEGLDPVVARELISKKAEIENAAKLQEGKLNEVLAGVNKEFDKERQAYKDEIAKVAGERDLAHRTLKKTTIERALETAFSKAKGKSQYLDDVKLRADRFGVFEDGKKIYMLDDDGENPKRHPKDGLRYVEPDDFIADMSKVKTDWFEPSGGGGGGGGKTPSLPGGTVSRDDQAGILANLEKMAKGEVQVQ